MAKLKVDPPALDHPLNLVFRQVHNQVTGVNGGKGERHGGGTVPFYDQQWVTKAKVHGNGFLTGQAAKKLDEAVERLAQRAAAGEDVGVGTPAHEAWEREVLGAIAYLGMAVLQRQGFPR